MNLSKIGEKNTWKVFNCAEISQTIFDLANHRAMFENWDTHGSDSKESEEKEGKPIKYQNDLVINDVWIGAHQGGVP
jgi:hypothetical protein